MNLSVQEYDPDVIEARLRELPLIREVHVYQSITSTNTVAKRLAESGSPSGTLVLADRQTAGRGRMGRRWESPPGVGLWFSLLLRPSSPRGWHLLPMVLSEVLAKAFSEAVGVPFQVKWPNDVVHRGRKVCGILCESSSSEAELSYIVAGIGINVNQRLEDFPAELRGSAESLRSITGRMHDRIDLLIHLLRRVQQRLLPALSGAEPLRLQQWQKLCSDIGRRIAVIHDGRSTRGIFEAVAENGDLLLRLDDGSRRRIPYGKASMRQER